MDGWMDGHGAYKVGNADIVVVEDEKKHDAYTSPIMSRFNLTQLFPIHIISMNIVLHNVSTASLI